MTISLPTKTMLALLAVALTCFGVMLSSALNSSLVSDSYLHLGIGRYVMENVSIPTHGDISYREVEPALEWISHSWLSDTIVYLPASVSLQYGPLLILLPLYVLSTSILWLIAKELGISRDIQLTALALVTILSTTFWVIHPLVFAIPLFLGILYSFLLWRKGTSVVILALPLLSLLWANMAGGYILIASFLIILYTLWECIAAPLLARATRHGTLLPRGNQLLLIASIVLSFCTSLLNPYGFRIYLYGVTGYALLGKAKWYSTLAGMLEASNTSVFKTDISPTLYVLFLLYAVVTILLCAMYLIRDRTKFLERVWSVIPLMGVFWLGFYFIRFIPLAVFGTLPFFALVSSYSQTKIRYQLKTVPLAVLLCIALVYIFATTKTRDVFVPPVEQCEMIRSSQLVPNVLVSTDIVGYAWYCMYPQKQQIDARDDFFDTNDTIGIYTTLSTISEENIHQLIEQNSIRTILVSKENDYITTFFNKRSDWSLLYIDYNGIVFSKNETVSDKTLAALKLNYVDLGRNLGFDPANIKEAISEMKRFQSQYPQNILARGQLASLYRFAKQYENAEALLRELPESSWGFALYTEMGRLQAAKGDCKESERYFLHALEDRSEQNVSKTVLDLMVLYGACFHDMAKAKHYLNRYTSYPLPEYERERAFAIAKQFHIELDSP